MTSRIPQKIIIYYIMTIPYILYKTGPFETITHPTIVECFQTNEKMLKSKIVYFNDRACKNFIKQHFGPNIVKAYNKLIPGAYKADLWRLCILYIHGGIYGDLTQTFVKEYDVNKDNPDIILVRDRGSTSGAGVYNAFMAAKKRNGFIQYCIEKLVKQILMNDLGRDSLDITGPQALRRHYLTFFKKRTIDLGLQTLVGIDNKVYRINIPFYHEESSQGRPEVVFCHGLDHGKVFLNRVKNHYKIVYNNNNIDYSNWWNKQMFKLHLHHQLQKSKYKMPFQKK